MNNNNNNKSINIIVCFVSFPLFNVAINLQPYYLALSGFGPRIVTPK